MLYLLPSWARPAPGLSSSTTLFPPAWISSMARVWEMPRAGSPLISTISSPTCQQSNAKTHAITHHKHYFEIWCCCCCACKHTVTYWSVRLTHKMCIIKEKHTHTVIPQRYDLLLEMTKYLRIKRVNMSFCSDLIRLDTPLHPSTGKVIPTDHSLAGLRLIPHSAIFPSF